MKFDTKIGYHSIDFAELDSYDITDLMATIRKKYNYPDHVKIIHMRAVHDYGMYDQPDTATIYIEWQNENL